jgi:hypothetical protein
MAHTNGNFIETSSSRREEGLAPASKKQTDNQATHADIMIQQETKMRSP